MLTSLLPGLRHFRTPFAVGALFAFQLWLIFGKSIPEPNQTHGIIERIYSLGNAAGRPIVTAVIAFTVYLIGDCVKMSPSSISTVHSNLEGRLYYLSRDSEMQLLLFAATAFDAREHSRPPGDSMARLAKQIRIEFPQIRARLIAGHADVYLEHDRLASEAEFRINVAIFTATLWCTLAYAWTPAALGILPVSFILYKNGLAALRESNNLLVQVIVSEIVPSRRFEEEKARNRADPE
ncbi:hypothetical protein [Streptomyces flaveus]|uniref:hypothetical protein n=1 Tax=Streptomyces flaveus TaxID=66370 RepID=UPI00331B3FC5